MINVMQRAALRISLLACLVVAAAMAPGTASASLYCPAQNTPPGVGWLCGPQNPMYGAWGISTDSTGQPSYASVCVRAYYYGYGFIGGTVCDNYPSPGHSGTALLIIDSPPAVNGYAYPINNHPYNHYIAGQAGV